MIAASTPRVPRTKRARLVLHGLVICTFVLQLSGCATSRGITRGTGAVLGAAGALSMLFAFAPDCDPDELSQDCNGDYYDEETLERRGVLLAGGSAAVLVGGGLVAASVEGKKKRRRYAQVVQPPPDNARPPATHHGQALRELIEQRCLPSGTAVDLRVPFQNGRPRAPLPPCPTP